MSKIKPNYNFSGKFFIRKQILKFKSNNELISDDDIMNLLLGLVRLIKKSTEIKTEEKFIKEIELLKREIRTLKSTV